MIWIQNQLVGAQEGQQMTLECHSEAFPKSINYWTRENNVIIANGTFIFVNTRLVLINEAVLFFSPSSFTSAYRYGACKILYKLNNLCYK